MNRLYPVEPLYADRNILARLFFEIGYRVATLPSDREIDPAVLQNLKEATLDLGRYTDDFGLSREVYKALLPVIRGYQEATSQAARIECHLRIAPIAKSTCCMRLEESDTERAWFDAGMMVAELENIAGNKNNKKAIRKCLEMIRNYLSLDFFPQTAREMIPHIIADAPNAYEVAHDWLSGLTQKLWKVPDNKDRFFGFNGLKLTEAQYRVLVALYKYSNNKNGLTLEQLKKKSGVASAPRAISFLRGHPETAEYISDTYPARFIKAAPKPPAIPTR